MQIEPDVRRPGRGYRAVVVGSLASASAAGAAAVGLVAALVSCEGSGLECLRVVVVVFVIGIVAAFAAAAAGAYAGLRLWGHDRAGRTAGILAALLPVALVVTYLTVDALSVVAPVASLAGAAVVARRIAVGSSSHRNVIDTKGETT